MSFNRDSNKILAHPKSKELRIDIDLLKGYVGNYRTAVESRLTFNTILSVIGLWSPVVAGDFVSFLGQTKDAIKCGYIVFAALVTLFIVWPFFMTYFVRPLALTFVMFGDALPKKKKGFLMDYVNRRVMPWAKEFAEKTEADSSRFVDSIAGHCG